MQLDLLAIGAHPDDVELSCGGTIAKSVRMGYKVGILDLTEGELGTRGTRAMRKKEAATAAKILGVHARENLRLPDGTFEIDIKNRLKLIEILRHFRPKVILIPHGQERHPDHVRAHHLCREAWFYSGLTKLRTSFRGKRQEPWRPDYLFHYMQRHEFIPSFIVDVSDVHETKMKAVRAYESQFHNPRSRDPETFLSRPSFIEFIEIRSRYLGDQIGVRHGEAFFSTNPFGIDDLLRLKLLRG